MLPYIARMAASILLAKAAMLRETASILLATAFIKLFIIIWKRSADEEGSVAVEASMSLIA
jgi:nicotinamide riboside transporter PnuC